MGLPSHKISKSGKHRNLPSIIRQPSFSSYACPNSRGQESSKEDAAPSARNPAFHTDQPSESLFTEVYLENHQPELNPEELEKQDAYKNYAESNTAANRTHGAQDSGAVPEESKENSLPSVSVNPSGRQPQGAVVEIIMTRNASGPLTLTAAPACSTDIATRLHPAGAPELEMNSVSLMPFNIHSMPIYQVVQPQSGVSVNILPALTNTCTSETVSVPKNTSSLQEHVTESPSVNQSSITQPASNIQPEELDREVSSSERHSMVQKPSPPTTPRRKVSKGCGSRTCQYQCPKCLCRFDSIMAQLKHECHPEKSRGGSLQSLPSVKLYKCLECREEFSNLEEKIRHTCLARMQAESMNQDSAAGNSRPDGPSLPSAKRQGKAAANRQMAMAGKGHGIGLYTTPHVDNKSQKKTKKTPCTCRICGTIFPNLFKLKKHELNEHFDEHCNIKTRGKCHHDARSFSPHATQQTSNIPKTVHKENKRDRHIDNRRFKCGLCDMKYRQVGFLKKHIALHMGSDEYKRSKLPYICRLCKVGFGLSKALKAHSMTNCNIPKKKNAGVNQTSTGSSQLADDAIGMKDTDKQVNQVVNSFQKDSNLASSATENSTNRRLSHQSAPSRQPHKCGFCGTRCDSATALRKHVRTHWNEIFEKHSNPLICSRCSEEFDDCVKLYLHVRRNGCSSASDDTNLSDENGNGSKEETPGTIDKPENESSSPHGKAKACLQEREHHCKHCNLSFFSSQVLDVHLQSSHPLLLPKQVTAAPEPARNEEASCNGIQEGDLPQKERLQDPVSHTQCRVSEPKGEKSVPCEQAPAYQDAAEVEDPDISRRTQALPCRCNTCSIDFLNWRGLDGHRRASHPEKVRHLQLGVNELGSISESVDEPSLEIVKTDFFHPCDLCNRVFKYWRSMVLHKKVKHCVNAMFARHSSRRHLDEETAKPGSYPVGGQTAKNPTSESPMAQASNPDIEGCQDREGIHVLEMGKSPGQDQQQPLPSISVLPQNPSTGVPEKETENVGNKGREEVRNLRTCDSGGKSSGDVGKSSAWNVSPEQKWTVEDLKILSVVSLANTPEQEIIHVQQGLDSTPDQGSESAAEVTANPQPCGQERKKWQQMLEDMFANVKCGQPAHTRETANCLRSITQEEVSEVTKMVHTQDDTCNACASLLDSVLALVSSHQPNNFGSVSITGHPPTANRHAFPEDQPRRHGPQYKIPFEEAKSILKVLEKNPISNSYHCRVCGEWFKNIRPYVGHVLAHCDLELYVCSICRLKSRNIFTVLQHIIAAHSLSQESAESTTNAMQSHCPAKELENTDPMVLCDNPELLTLSKAGLDPTCTEGHQQMETFSRPVCDYTFKPSELEMNLRPDSATGAYRCPLCPFWMKEKGGVIYHLRIHHKQHAYTCRRCHETFNFMPDVQVHFTRCHSVVMEAAYQPTGKALENLDMPLSSQHMQQTENAWASGPHCHVAAPFEVHSEVLSEVTSLGKTLPVALPNYPDEPRENSTVNVSASLPRCMDVGEQACQRLNITPKGQPLASSEKSQQINCSGEDIPTTTTIIKMERLTDDITDNPSTLMNKEDTVNCMKTTTECLDSGITVKTESLNGSGHQRCEQMWQQESFVNSYHQTTGVSAENLQYCEPGVASVISSTCIVNDNKRLCKVLPFSSFSTPPPSVSEEGRSRDAEDSEPSVMTAENEMAPPSGGPDIQNHPKASSSHSVIPQECEEVIFNREDIQGNLLKDVGAEKDATNPVEPNPCTETFGYAESVRSTADVPHSDKEAKGCDEFALPDCSGEGLDEVLVRVGASSSVKDATSKQTLVTNGFAEIDEAAASKEKCSLVDQSLDDLFQLASDIGITVTESDTQQDRGKEITSEYDGDSCKNNRSDLDRFKNGGEDYQSSDVKCDDVQTTEMDSCANLTPSLTVQTVFGNDSNVQQMDASSASTDETSGGVGKNAGTDCHSGENLIRSSVCGKRTSEECGNSEDTVKRRRLQTSPFEENIKILSKPAPDTPLVRIKQEPRSPVSGECLPNSFPNAPRKEMSESRVPLPVVEDQQDGSLLDDISISEDEIVAEILKDIVKNSFTSKILASFQRESTGSICHQNSLDLDLFTTPPYVGPSSGASTKETGQHDVSLSKVQNHSLVKSRHALEKALERVVVNDSGLPKIFDVAGNGQMPKIPSGCKIDKVSNTLQTSSHQDEEPAAGAVVEAFDIESRTEKRGKNSELRTLLSGSPQLLYTPLHPFPNEPRSTHRTSSSEAPSTLFCSDTPNKDSFSPRLWDELPTVGHHINSQHQAHQGYFGARRHSCEESWIGHCQGSELISPQSGGDPPALLQRKAGNYEQPYWDLSDNRQNLIGSSFQSDTSQELQLLSPQTNSPSTRYMCGQANSFQYPQQYQVPQTDGSKVNGQVQENGEFFFQTSHSRMAALNKMSESTPAHDQWGVHSNRQHRMLNDYQMMQPAGTSTQLNNVSPDHCTRSFEANGLEASSGEHRAASQGQWNARRAPQQKRWDFHCWNGPSRNPHSQPRRPQLRKQPLAPECFSASEPTGLYRYHRVSQPSRSRQQEELEAYHRNTHQATCPPSQQRSAYGSESRFPANHVQENTPLGLPQIVSVTSLHPSYLQQ